ncbi:xanthine dehydrogenase YagR molybdenum-binding subunit [Thermocatellispora tengchongensis]|uniref:Xanthine dehydrogenase YagR molybdenum-binding subunit n=1 Tax=Thermocatellispora tengchongensis TaxID=1073253 RepID=A0A840P396_9ACTN|nr:xanthine dehydrogenase family protein molybdopterin-binding subunit [Thermocatellispora tengchongensis]MBB5132373.1 xanthine dehydrogenase YagR molybdenum-binding subunit [Thermocatellispora tengchongensis]
MTRTSLGAPLDRVDGRAKVTGAARYAADNNPAGLAHGYFVLSTIAKGTIRSIDAARASAAPGVLAVYSHANPLRLLPPRSYIAQFIGEPQRAMQDAVVRHYGQIVAMVVAETFEQARDAAALVTVEYDAQPPAADFLAGVPGARDPQTPFGHPVTILADGVPDIDAALAASEVTHTAVYTQPPEHHNPMEPHSAVAMWDGGKLTIHSGSQGPALHALDLAEGLGVPQEDVHVIGPYVGGGFGGKATSWSPTLLAAAAARALRRPVKVVTTREQLFTVTGHRTASHLTVTLGARRDGTLTAVKNLAVTTFEIENPASPPTAAYKCPNLDLRLKVVDLDIPRRTIMRAPGYAAGTFGLECAMDELAHELGLDPIELRMRNYATASPDKGLPYASKHLDECYRVGAERFGWSRRKAEPRSVTDGQWLVGMGMATCVLPSSQHAGAARVRFRANGTVEVACNTADLGTGAMTVLAMAGADRLGLPVGRIRPALGDSTLPVAAEGDSFMGAVGSAATSTILSAVHDAAGEAITALIAHAVSDARSPFHGMDAQDVRYSSGVLEGGGRRAGFGELLTTTGTPGVEAVTTATLGEDTERYAFITSGAHFCEVRVHRLTGEARLSRVTCVVDAGTIVNGKTARGQIAGGVVMSAGQALLEGAYVEPATGRIANANFADYLVPVNADIPAVDVHFLDHPDTRYNPQGARGLGELTGTGVAAAIANAIYNATGTRVRDLPITPDKLLS